MKTCEGCRWQIDGECYVRPPQLILNSGGEGYSGWADKVRPSVYFNTKYDPACGEYQEKDKADESH